MAFSFNTNNQQAANKPTFSFGGANTSNAPAAGTSTAPTFSFGNTTSSAQQQQAQGSTPSLFGQSNTNQPQAAGQQQPSTSGFSFGGGAQNQQQQQQPAAGSSGFSFGGFGAKPAGQQSTAQAPSTFSGFGSLGQNQQQQQNKPTFSFGAPATNASTSGPNLFGSQQTSQPQPAGASQSALVTAPSVQITKSTRFEDLPEAERKQIEAIEEHIQGRIAIYDSLKSQNLGRDITETRTLMRELAGEFAGLRSHLAQDYRATSELKARFERSVRDGANAAQLVNAIRAPVQPGNQSGQPSAKPNPLFLQEFFHRKAEEMANRLQVYKNSIEQIHSQLARSDPDQVKAILPTLKAQHSATLQLAGKVSSLEGNVTELRDEYRDLWRERTGSVRDPFIERRRQVLGSEAGVLDSVNSLRIR